LRAQGGAAKVAPLQNMVSFEFFSSIGAAKAAPFQNMVGFEFFCSAAQLKTRRYARTRFFGLEEDFGRQLIAIKPR
jgi:hypothetical protein